MLRSIRNLKCLGFVAGVRRGCTVLAEVHRTDVHLVLPTALSSEFAKEIAPLSVPVLVEQYSRHAPGGQFATIAEYLRSDPLPNEALVPEEIDLHRSMTLDDLNTYMQAKTAFQEPRRKGLNFAHVLVVAGTDFLQGCPFQQRSEFLYLCDCLRPGSVLVLHRSRKKKTGALLFLSEKVDPELARIFSRMHHVDEVLPLDMLKKNLFWLLKEQSPELWHSLEPSSEVSRIVNEASEEVNIPLANPRYILQYTRTFKTDRELCVLRRANAIAAESMAEVIAYNLSNLHQCNPRELTTLFDYNCRRRYAHPDQPLSAKVTCGSDASGLWHMDAGCQYGGYRGGLVRTWPGAGRFTPPQRMLYGALLDMRRDLCALVEASGVGGAVSTPLELHAAYLILLARHLQELRILSNTKRSPSETVEAARKFNCTPVVVSHVGIDLCDTSRKLLGYPLAPRNVLSLRLSIFVPDDCCEANPEFRGILCQLGDTLYIRDDYSVEVLTAHCPSKHNPGAGSVRAPVRLIKNKTGLAILRVISGPKAFKVVLFTRLTPIPFGLQNLIFGISSVGTKDYHLATMLGLLPAQTINVYLGSTLRSMHEVLNDNQTKLTGYISFVLEVVCGVVLMFWVVQKARKELSETLISVDYNSDGKHTDIEV